MAVYLIGDVQVRDPKAYEDYRRQVLATIQKFGGRFVVRGGAHEVIEGTWRPNRIVVIEFPDMATLKAWYASPDYAPQITLRQKASTGSLIAVEGAPPQ